MTLLGRAPPFIQLQVLVAIMYIGECTHPQARISLALHALLAIGAVFAYIRQTYQTAHIPDNCLQYRRSRACLYFFRCQAMYRGREGLGPHERNIALAVCQFLGLAVAGVSAATGSAILTRSERRRQWLCAVSRPLERIIDDATAANILPPSAAAIEQEAYRPW